MRTKTPNTKAQTKVPEMPKKSVHLSINDLDRIVARVPIWFEGDPEKGFDAPGQFACLCAPIGLAGDIAYRKKYGETPDVTNSKIMFMQGEMYRVNQALQNPATSLDELRTMQQELAGYQAGTLSTPFGPLTAPMNELLGQLVAFILSWGGRITRKIRENEYETDPIEPEDIIDAISRKNRLMEDDGDGTPLFYEILEISEVWSYTQAKERMKEAAASAGGAKDDEPGNLSSESSGEDS